MTIYDQGRSPEHWLLALDIASCKISMLDPSESAIDALCWMNANDFDVAFVQTDPVSIVQRSELQSGGEVDRVGDYAKALPQDHICDVGISMNSAFHELNKRSWLALVQDGEIQGVLTCDDLAKPAAKAFVLAHLITLERALRRLCGSYSNRPIPDEPAVNEHGHCHELPVEPISDLSTLLNKAANIDLLVEELGYSKEDFRRISGWAVTLGSHLTDSRRMTDDAPGEPSILQRFILIQKLMHDALRLIDQRPQIWRAFTDSIIYNSDNGDRYAGPGSVDIPIPMPSYVITAANPFEQHESDRVNDHRNQMLRKVLEKRATYVIEVIGSSRCGNWKEKSFLVSGVPKSEILNLAKQYGQRAIFKLTADQKLVLSTDGQTKGRVSRHT
jgi:hypothetical protein